MTLKDRFQTWLADKGYGQYPLPRSRPTGPIPWLSKSDRLVFGLAAFVFIVVPLAVLTGIVGWFWLVSVWVFFTEK